MKRGFKFQVWEQENLAKEAEQEEDEYESRDPVEAQDDDILDIPTDSEDTVVGLEREIE